MSTTQYTTGSKIDNQDGGCKINQWRDAHVGTLHAAAAFPIITKSAVAPADHPDWQDENFSRDPVPGGHHLTRKGLNICINLTILWAHLIEQTSVVDPERFNADLDPTFHADADLDPEFFARKGKQNVF